MEKKFGILSSSVDPEQLAATVTGVMKAVAGLLVFWGVLSTTDAGTAVNSIGQLVTLGITLWGVCETIFGILRKVLVAIQQRFAH